MRGWLGILTLLLAMPWSVAQPVVTRVIDDTDEVLTRELSGKRGHGTNPEGTDRGYRNDPGDVTRLRNVSEGTYTWWTNTPGKDVFAYRPKVKGSYRVWISWGCGWPTHTTDAHYVLDRDGDVTTRNDQQEIAVIDQQRFADGSGDLPKKALWSGFKDAGIHTFTSASVVLIRGGENGTAITADKVILQAVGVSDTLPWFKAPIDAAGNEDRFAPVMATGLRFMVDATNKGHEPCIDELEVWSGDTNVAKGAVPTSSGNYANNPKHQLKHINDGKYGNDFSWISNTHGYGWVALDWKQPVRIDRITWARDREKKYKDRTPIEYTVEVRNGADEKWVPVFMYPQDRPELESEVVFNPEEATPEELHFVAHLKPVFERKCLSCHNPNIKKGKLSMHIRSAFEDRDVLDGKKLLAVIQPGPAGEAPEMPEEGEPFTESEIELLQDWLAQGAPWPEGLVLREASKADRSWWAYQALEKPTHASVDAYVEAKLAEQGLAMNPPADPRTLIRRMTYDLTGLPPTPEEVDAFVKAYRANPTSSVGQVLDRLLASPRYGERWGRHWLDVVRFGESNGFERNVIIDSLWPFRDYVIKSINDDKPFDQFIREHLAGDVVGAGDPEQMIGSAFLVAGPYDNVGNQDAVQRAQIRANTLDEIIIATGEAFLGMTIGCARCHDHKFDPITTEDYYGLYATFSGIRHGNAVMATPQQQADRRTKLKPLEQQKAELEQQQKALNAEVNTRANELLPTFQKQWTRPPVDRMGTEERFEPVRARFVRLVGEAGDISPTSKNFRIDEFEAWTAGDESRNVALAAQGGKARGAARKIEDFPGAYGAHLAIDGKAGERFISANAELVVEFAQPELIDRVIFSSARGESTPGHRKFSFLFEYRIEVSEDGSTWKEVANGRDRKPPSTALRNFRTRMLAIRPEEKTREAELVKKLAAVNREIAAIPGLTSAWIGTRNARDAQGPFHVFTGGSPQKKAKRVVPASLSPLNDTAPTYRLHGNVPEAERREVLAGWMTDPKNPLPPRVLANRVWQHHFGTGIVDTPNDFGWMGGRPTHPELLDFLAVKLLENGWRLKPLHRLIMTSRAYQQSSAYREDAAAMDGDSRMLWRFPPRRLSAEEIRDTFLMASGKLDLKMGGPGFRLYKYLQDNVATYVPRDAHGPETYRRAVYHQNARASVIDLMTDFDQPDCALSSPRRVETTTPLQALTMMNHAFTVDMAEALAKRGATIPGVYRLAYQRAPDDEERTRAEATVAAHGLRAFSRAVLNSSELIYLD